MTAAANPLQGDIGIRRRYHRLIGDLSGAEATRDLDAKGMAVSPGFIDMQSQSMQSLLQDGRSMGAIRQGVTLEIFGEGSSEGPYTDTMKAIGTARRRRYQIQRHLENAKRLSANLQKNGVSTNVASFVGAATLRENLLGFDNRTPDSAQLEKMKTLVRQAMEDGALGIGSALIYAPGSYAKTPELIELCKICSALRRLLYLPCPQRRQSIATGSR
jgi:N-acyl-D-amino-acid deacylase